MRAGVLIGAVALLAALFSAGRSDSKPRRPRVKPVATAVALAAAPARRITVRVVARGHFTELRFDDRRLTVKSSVAMRARARPLDAATKDRFEAAVRTVLTTQDTRRTCGVGETFVTVTLDGTTNFTALCPDMPQAWRTPWQALLDLSSTLAAEQPQGAR